MSLRACAIALALIGLVAVSGCGGGDDSGSDAAAPNSGAFVLGSWHGDLHQEGTPHFEVDARVRSLEDAGRNRVSYTVIDCTGTWKYEGFDRGSYRFEERTDSSGGDLCKGVGQVTLTPAGNDRARFEFRGGGVTSHGILRRRD